MRTRDAILIINKYFDSNHLGICSLGRTAEEAFLNMNNNQILFLDCLGSVTGTAIGVALGCKNCWVNALDTDGSFMYCLSILHTLSVKKSELRKLTIYIFDNQILESGGGLASRYVSLDWRLLFKSWNVSSIICKNRNDLESFLKKRKEFEEIQIVILKINNTTQVDVCRKDIDGYESKYMFKRYINDNIKKGIIRPCLKN